MANTVFSESQIEALEALARATDRVAESITPCVAGGRDDSGSYVASLTEAVMGNTAGLMAIASAIHDLASAVREHTVWSTEAGNMPPLSE